MKTGTDAKDGKGKTKTHWGEWEIGCLLGRTLEGIDLGVIADGMGRSLSACRTMLGRLINGEVECPAVLAYMLDEIRKQNTPKPRTRQADQQIVEQYRALARGAEATASRLAGIENAVVYLLATKVVEGCIPILEISRFCLPAISRGVLKIAGTISEHRKHPELFTKEPSAAEKTDNRQPTTDSPEKP